MKRVNEQGRVHRGRRPRDAWRHVGLILLPVILAFLGYANSLRNGFVYDDLVTVEECPFIRDLGNLKDLVSPRYFFETQELSYRPLLTLTYFVDYAIWKDRPFGYHATNLVCHAGNALLLFFSAQALGLPGWGASLASALFAVHPAATEAVNGVSFREDLLALLFVQASLLLFLKGGRGLWPSWGFFLASLLCKESGAVFPFFLLLLPAEGTGANRSRRRTIPFFLLLALYGLFRLLLLGWTGSGSQESWNLKQRLGIVPQVLLLYLRLAVCPIRLSAEYVFEPVQSFLSPEFWGFGALLALLVAGSVWGWVRKPRLFWGLCAFWLALLPVSNLLPLPNTAAERYLYLPLFGACLFFGNVVLWIRRLPGPGQWLWAPFPCLLLPFLVLTWRRNEVWRDELTLCQATVARCPESDRFLFNLSNAYWDAGDLQAAERCFLALIERRPGHVDAQVSLGLLYAEEGRLDLAEARLNGASASDPGDPEPLINLASVHEKMGRFEEALADASKAVSLAPAHPDALYNRGRLLFSLGRPGEALNDLQASFAARPSAESARYAAQAFARLGQIPLAASWFEKALSIDPGNASAWADYGRFLREQNRLPEAIGSLLRAIQIAPPFLDVRLELARCYKASGDLAMALATCQEAVQLAPNAPGVLDACGGFLIREKIDPKIGRSLIERAAVLAPEDAAIRAHLEESRTPFEGEGNPQ